MVLKKMIIARKEGRNGGKVLIVMVLIFSLFAYLLLAKQKKKSRKFGTTYACRHFLPAFRFKRVLSVKFVIAVFQAHLKLPSIFSLLLLFVNGKPLVNYFFYLSCTYITWLY